MAEFQYATFLMGELLGQRVITLKSPVHTAKLPLERCAYVNPPQKYMSMKKKMSMVKCSCILMPTMRSSILFFFLIGLFIISLIYFSLIKSEVESFFIWLQGTCISSVYCLLFLNISTVLFLFLIALQEFFVFCLFYQIFLPRL